jgi:CheY-like chemotaxis protein
MSKDPNDARESGPLERVSWGKLRTDGDLRNRLSRVKVLLADRDTRTASLVHRILYSFGFRNITMVTSGEHALQCLRTQPFDLIITEWNMEPVDGLTLVLAIRRAKEDARIPRDIPIIMLTAFSELENVEAARDAGITEFVRKPFSAKTMSKRIVQVIDNPRLFIDSPVFAGPDRRRRNEYALDGEKRSERKNHRPPPGVTILPPNASILEQLDGAKAAHIITPEVVEEAQRELVKAEGEFVAWAEEDLNDLEAAYQKLSMRISDAAALDQLRSAAYRIKSQAGIFGYDIGTEVAGLLVKFLDEYAITTKENLVILRKHIDALSVVFMQKIKGQERIGKELIASLRQLIAKLG